MGTSTMMLPPGFVEDAPDVGLPAGFIADQPPQANQASAMPEQPRRASLLERFKAANRDAGQGMVNAAAGAVRGAGSIGATILAPYDIAQDALEGKGWSLESNRERRAAIDEGLQSMGAQPDSLPYKGGKIVGEIAGTAGVGGLLGKGAGLVSQTPRAQALATALTTSGMKAGTAPGAANMATRIVGGAATGGVATGMIDPESAGTGAIIGGALPPALAGIGKIGGAIGNAGRSVINPVFRPETAAVQKLVQDAGGVEKARAAIARTIAAGRTMSGQPFTLGQAGKNAGLSSTERARSAVNPEHFQPIYQAQREARVAALQGIGGDDVALQNAIENRDLAANSLYGKAFKSDQNRVDFAKQELAGRVKTATGGIAQRNNVVEAQLKPDLATDGLRELSQRPAFQAAIKQAQSLASNKGFDIGDPLQSLQGLHYVKLALDDMLNPQAASSMGRNASASIMDMRDKLAKELSDIAPLYGNARSTYAEMSAPINQMKVGKKLTDVLTGEAFKSGANAKQQAEQFFRALKNAPSIVKTETGLKQPLSKVFDDNQLSSVKQVAQELARDVDLQNLGRGVGSDTAQKLARGNIPNALESLVRAIPYGGKSLDVGSELVKTRVNKQFDNLLQNPDMARAAVAKLSKGEINKLMQMVEFNNPTGNALTQLIYRSAPALTAR